MTTHIEKDMSSQDLGGQRHLKNNFETLAHFNWHFGSPQHLPHISKGVQENTK